MPQREPRRDGGAGGHDAGPVAAGGYRWLYFDGLSDDGEASIVAIFLLGSPFSPAYQRAVRRDPSTPAEHYASVNVAVYGRGRASSLWVLTNHRGATRGDGWLGIGGSSVCRTKERVDVRIDERRPWSGARVRGRFSFTAKTHGAGPVHLDARGRHRWWPVAPDGEIEVELDEPRVRFRGRGYHDSNSGDEPLDRAFREWSWSRTHLPGGRALVSYGVTHADGGSLAHARIVAPAGSEAIDVQPWTLPTSRWGLRRLVWAPTGAEPCLGDILEDGPFYARHRVLLTLDGAERTALAETLSARRLAHPVTSVLIPFRTRVAR